MGELVLVTLLALFTAFGLCGNAALLCGAEERKRRRGSSSATSVSDEGLLEREFAGFYYCKAGEE